MATLKEYYARAPEVVLKAVEDAVEEYGRAVSLREVDRIGYESLPLTEHVFSPAGYTPFDFPDRLRKWLRRLVKQGKLLELGDHRKYFYLPTEKGKFTGDHVTPDLPGELYDHEM